jgi:NADH-quinone oxidoreductase subunit H
VEIKKIDSVYLSILGLLIIIVINIVLMLILTVIIASLTLIERKFLALVQRRVGPNFVGYKGRLQYIADALKLFLKGSLVPDESNKFLFVTIPSIALAICYSFWMNGVWGPSIALFEIEYNLIYISLFSVLFGMCVILTGYFSKNKYAMLAAVRTGIGMLNLELFLGLMILNVILMSESFSFLQLVIYQENYWFIFLFFGLSGLIIITFLLETSRAPFDLPEAESELVTGYTTEYGGFFFGLYYLGEYLHLFFFSLIISIIFFGGWELPNFFFNFYNYYINVKYIF